jgi:hypothetical protein
MACIANKAENTISLFPVFNIMICVLGILIFILNAIVTLSLGAGQVVDLIIEDLEGSAKRTPVFLEWDGTLLTYHQNKEFSSSGINLARLGRFPKADDAYRYVERQLEGSRIEELIHHEMVIDREKYFLILVRPNGFDTLAVIRGYFKSIDIDIGYEPISGNFRITKK